MLFPDNKKKRDAWTTRNFILSKAKTYSESTISDKKTESIGCKKLGEDFAQIASDLGGPEIFTNLLLESSRDDINQEGTKRYPNGIIVGNILLDRLTTGKKLTDAIFDYCKKNNPGIEQETIRKHIWYQFLPMAHYWAAIVTFNKLEGFHIGNNIDNPDSMFYCQKLREINKPDGIKGLIFLAESYFFQSTGKIPLYSGQTKKLIQNKKMFFVLHPFINFL